VGTCFPAIFLRVVVIRVVIVAFVFSCLNVFAVDELSNVLIVLEGKADTKPGRHFKRESLSRPAGVLDAFPVCLQDTLKLAQQIRSVEQV
jgi:hypothetical protein